MTTQQTLEAIARICRQTSGTLGPRLTAIMQLADKALTEIDEHPTADLLDFAEKFVESIKQGKRSGLTCTWDGFATKVFVAEKLIAQATT